MKLSAWKSASCAVLLFAAFGNAARAQGELTEDGFDFLPAPRGLAVLDHGWKDLPAGAWVEVKLTRQDGHVSTERSERRTLKAYTDGGAAMLLVTDPAAKPGSPAVIASEEDEIVPADGFEGERSGKEVIGGREIYPSRCKWNSADGRVTVTIWSLYQIRQPGSVVKRERLGPPDAAGKRPRFVREVAEWDRWAEVDGRKVLCTVWNESETFADGTSRETVELQSFDVPGLLVSRTTRGTRVIGGKSVDFAEEEIATAFSDDPATDAATLRRCDVVRAAHEWQEYGYAGFGVGSRIEHRSVSKDRDGKTWINRRAAKVLELRPAGALLETSGGAENPQPDGSVRFEPWSTSSMELAGNGCYVGRMQVRFERDEEVTVAGKKWRCGVFTETWPSAGYQRKGPRTMWFARVWFSPDFPANRGIIRQERGVGPEGREPVISETESVTDTAREYQVNGKAISCWVTRRVNDHDKADAIYEAEQWFSDEVPGRSVRYVGGRRIQGKLVVDVTTELVDLVVVREPPK